MPLKAAAENPQKRIHSHRNMYISSYKSVIVYNLSYRGIAVRNLNIRYVLVCKINFKTA